MRDRAWLPNPAVSHTARSDVPEIATWYLLNDTHIRTCICDRLKESLKIEDCMKAHTSYLSNTDSIKAGGRIVDTHTCHIHTYSNYAKMLT